MIFRSWRDELFPNVTLAMRKVTVLEQPDITYRRHIISLYAAAPRARKDSDETNASDLHLRIQGLG